MSEDFLRSHIAEISYQLALQDISSTLKLHGFSLSSFDLPTIEDVPQNVEKHREKIQFGELTQMMATANEEQSVFIEEIFHLLQNNDASVSDILIGWTRRDWKDLYRFLIQSCINSGIQVISVAWTGIAAMLLPHGRTVHSRFKLPLNLHEHCFSSECEQ